MYWIQEQANYVSRSIKVTNCKKIGVTTMNLKYKSLWIFLAIGALTWVTHSKIRERSVLDEHYHSCWKIVKQRWHYGSAVDSRKDLEDYEDRLELYMHLDGYNAVEILNMKCQAGMEVAIDNKKT